MLKDLIKSRGIKQKWLASKLGVSEVTVSNWCSGKTLPTNDNFSRLSSILEVEINVLKNLNG
jgi:transcriptional regulator with XRE-family HTH domain